MNTQVIKELIEQVKILDIPQKILDAHQQIELKNITIGEWELPKFNHHFSRMLLQLEKYLNTEEAEYQTEWAILTEIDPNNNSVSRYLAYLIDRTTHNDWNTLQLSVKWLIAYQVYFKFWNKSKEKIHDADTIRLEEITEEIKVAQKQIDRQKSILGEKIVAVDNKLAEIQAFLEQKQRDLELITEKREEILNKLAEVSQALIDINNYKGQAEAVRNQSHEFRDEIKRILEEVKGVISQYNTDTSILKANLEKSLNEAEKKLGTINDDYTHIKDKREYIDLKELDIIKLASKAGDGALGHTFSTREENIGKSVKRWMWATYIMIVLLFGWIFVVFTQIDNGTYSPEWLTPLIGTLKTVPAFIILIFIARQYTKERNLQEEYAFKSAIAMTLTAYADEIAREDDDERRTIIRETIEKVYKAPKITTERMNFWGASSRQKKEYFDTLTNVLKEVAEKISTAK